MVFWNRILDRNDTPSGGTICAGAELGLFILVCGLALPCHASPSITRLPAGGTPGASILSYIADRSAAAVQPSPDRIELSREQALWAALAFEDTAKMASLLKLGADPNKRDELSQMTPLMAAESLPVAKILIDAGADPHIRDRAGRTALHHAAKTRDGAAIIELLVRMGADANARADDMARDTPLLCAIENYLEIEDRQQAELIIRALVHLGADINMADARGNTPLVIAATNNQPDLIRLLLELGADAARPAYGGRTPLDFAREANATEAMHALASAPMRHVPAN
jgi:ankyrin repeat protein